MTCIAVCSGKGSPGATFVAVNLANALAKAGRRPVFLDLDPHGGDVAAYLGLDPRKGLWPLGLVGPGKYSPQALLGEIDERCGIRCIAGFPRASDASAEVLHNILSSSSSRNHLVVADLGRVDERVAEVAAGADLILVVVRPDLVSTFGAERAREALLSAGANPSRMRLVTNAFEWRHAAEAAEVASAVGIASIAMIPLNRRGARRALEAQTPVGGRRLAKAFGELAGAVLKQAAATRNQEVSIG
ncbi:MAG: AAA family ATPase [Actinomycetota bacterium]